MKAVQIVCGVLLLIIIRVAVSRLAHDVSKAHSNMNGAPSNWMRSSEKEFQKVQSYLNSSRPATN